MTAKQYQEIIDRYIKQYSIKVVTYYKSFYGNSHISTKRIWIPKQGTELGFYLALHEIGHIATNIKYSAPEWLHEYSATKFAIDEAKKNGVTFSKEIMESIKGYLKYRIYLCIKYGIDAYSIPDKVYRLSGLNKQYCLKKINEGCLSFFTTPIENFFDWRHFKINWE